MTSPLLPPDGVASIAAHIAAHGSVGMETGGFLLVRRSEPGAVATVAHAGSVGILRHPRQFVISAGAVEALSEWADTHGERIFSQFHSHGGRAFLSPIDRAGGIRVAGFVTTVVPDFARPQPDPTLWGWWTFANGDWQSRPPLPVGASATASRIIVFDEAGVHGQ